MLLYPSEPQIEPMDGFTEENDIFGLREFGESLTNLVTSVDQPLVLTLDGPWGSGKSTFAKQWAGELRKRGLPVVLFDAFANDYQDDAFIALSAEIMAQAQELKGPKPLRSKFATSAKKIGSILTPVAAKASLRLLTAGMVTAADLNGLEEAVKGTSGDVGALLESAIGERLERAEKDRKSLDAFRDALKDLALGLSQKTAKEGEGNPQGPLVFIIDELDRCRPPFALNVLERIKHLFSVDGVCFVLVTNLDHLEATVRGEYGIGESAPNYLNKFFHLRIALPQHPTQTDRTSYRLRYIEYLWKSMAVTSGDESYDESLKRILHQLVFVYDLQLRDLERVMGHIVMVCSAVATPQHYPAQLVAGLAVMRLLDRQLFETTTLGALTWKEAKEFFAPLEMHGEQSAEHFLRCWRYATDEAEINEPWAGEFFKHHIRNNIERNELLGPLAYWMGRFGSAGQ